MARIDIDLHNGAKLAWETKEFSQICSPVIHDGYVYWVWHQMYCLDFKTGRICWKGGPFSEAASLIVAGDDRLIVWANRTRKELLLTESAGRSPDHYVELTSRPVPGDADAYPHVVLAAGRIYGKDRLGRIVCFEIEEPAQRERKNR
jgi:outer membrane protein assembly factor BamB